MTHDRATAGILRSIDFNHAMTRSIPPLLRRAFISHVSPFTAYVLYMVRFNNGRNDCRVLVFKTSCFSSQPLRACPTP